MMLGSIINVSSVSGIMGNAGEKAREIFLGQIPLGRVGTSADVAALALFLASDAFACFTGQVIPVDGGLSM
jgi:3-oxoacyl-[acyl-carrier protein] reductase